MITKNHDISLFQILNVMENLKWLFTEILSQIGGTLFTFTWYSVLFAFLGLIGGIVFVSVAGSKGLFRRSHGVWKVLAALNYGYIPLLLATLGGTFGATYAAHICAERFIDDTAKPLAAYGQKYLNQALALVPEIPWERHLEKSVDEVLAAEVASRLGAEPGTYAYEFYGLINRTVVQYTLEELGISNAVREPLAVVRDLQKARVPGNTFAGFPRALHKQCDVFFSVKYAWIFGLFLPFLLAPVAEHVLYRLLVPKKIRAQSSKKTRKIFH